MSDRYQDALGEESRPQGVYRISARDLTTEIGLGSRLAGRVIVALLIFAVCVVCWVL